MPPRTNEFQKLVKVINNRLAPAGAKITESAMLYDHEAETDREVDILIESDILNCNLKIGIECTTNKRPLDIPKIEVFVEKHRKIGINKTIIVSKSGFTPSAKIYGEKNHLKLLTFNSAKTENWLESFEKFKKLSVYGRNYVVRSIRILYSNQRAPSDFLFDKTNSVLFNGDWISLFDFAAQAFKNSKASTTFHKELRENELSVSDPVLELGFELGGGFEFKDQYGKSAWPDEMIVLMGYKSNYRDLNPKQISYDGNAMVVGGFFDGKSKQFASVALTESNGAIQGMLEVSSNILPATGITENKKMPK